MDIPDLTTKRCSKCGEVKPRNQFSSDKSSKDGLYFRCRACAAEMRHEYYVKHHDARIQKQREYNASNRDANNERQRERYAEKRDERQQRARDYYASHAEDRREYARRRRAENPGIVRESNKAYRAKHREELLDRRREYYLNNRDTLLDYARKYRSKHSRMLATKKREYYAEHPDIARASHQRRRARKIGSGGNCTPVDVAVIRASQTDTMGRLICWKCGKPIKGKAHLDHWIPLDKGGTSDPGNLHFMHVKCNLEKGAKHPVEIGRLL